MLPSLLRSPEPLPVRYCELNDIFTILSHIAVYCLFVLQSTAGNAVYHFPGPWIQRAATTINVSGQATGVYHLLGDWSQQAPVNITLSDNATGTSSVHLQPAVNISWLVALMTDACGCIGVRLWGANMVWMQQSSTTITSAAGSHNTS